MIDILTATLSRHRVGSDPIADVFLMEDHDEALQVWQKQGVSNRILLHIDAHIDFDWLPDRPASDLLNSSSLQELESLVRQTVCWDLTGRGAGAFVHIGNYICLAIKQKILRAFYWVTPDAPPGVSWEKKMRRLLDQFQGERPDALSDIRIEPKKVCATLFGFPLVICTLKSLPLIEEEVLLDIDTDFLISGFLTGKKEDPYRKKPWLFPEALVEVLRSKEIRSDCVTVAYSVEGGFTPLSYKYLGDALAQFIRDPSSDRTPYAHKRSAQLFQEKGETDRAISEYRKALDLNPKDAASLYNLSWLLLEKGEKENASRFYQEAVLSDPTYASAYTTSGWVYEGLGQWDKAKREYERMLSLDPNHAYSLGGMGDVYRSRKDSLKALSYYRQALARDPSQGSVYYGMGRIFFRQRKWEEALRAFQTALEFTDHDAEARLQFWIGSTLFKKREFRKAKESLLEASRLGLGAFPLHLRLARIYLCEGLYHKAGRELQKWVLLLWQKIWSYFHPDPHV